MAGAVACSSGWALPLTFSLEQKLRDVEEMLADSCEEPPSPPASPGSLTSIRLLQRKSSNFSVSHSASELTFTLALLLSDQNIPGMFGSNSNFAMLAGEPSQDECASSVVDGRKHARRRVIQFKVARHPTGTKTALLICWVFGWLPLACAAALAFVHIASPALVAIGAGDALGLNALVRLPNKITGKRRAQDHLPVLTTRAAVSDLSMSALWSSGLLQALPDASVLSSLWENEVKDISLPDLPEPSYLFRAVTSGAAQVQHGVSEEYRNIRTQLSPLSQPIPPSCSLPAQKPQPPPHSIVAMTALLKATLAAATARDPLVVQPREVDLEATAVVAAAAMVASAAQPGRRARHPQRNQPRNNDTSGVSTVSLACDKLPAGFDLELALRTASLSGIAYHMTESGEPDDARIAESLRETHDMELVRSFWDKKKNAFAYLACKGDGLFLVFRGSCSGENVLTDLDYGLSDNKSLSQFIRGSQLPEELEGQLTVHRGFLAAWHALKLPIMMEIERLQMPPTRQQAVAKKLRRSPPRPKTLKVTGHSMGGALGMLAAMELAGRFHNRPRSLRVGVHTFAAPRVGNCVFAQKFAQAYPELTHHWAIQGIADAVPHLPFAAWGFRHPPGSLLLDGGDPSSIDLECERLGDRGDPLHMLRPKEGKLINWAECHDMAQYETELGMLAQAAGACTAKRSKVRIRSRLRGFSQGLTWFRP